MSGNTFGNLFRITTWGESHGPAIGVVIDGCPSRLTLTEKDIQKELDRRRPQTSAASTSRKESDRVEILSGVFKGKTTGTPISLIIKNEDAREEDYSDLANIYRPSHADYTYESKYGIRDHRGGGRASARETAARVAAGAVAKKILSDTKIEIIAFVKQICTINSNVDLKTVTHEAVEKSPIRCPDKRATIKMQEAIEKARKDGESLGGVIECIIKNAPAGLGSPIFDKLNARLAHAMLSIPASRGFEVGSGFKSVEMAGSMHNDPIAKKGVNVITIGNNAGGIVGGISNGMDIIFRVAFKPVASISKRQETITVDGKKTSIKIEGRHDVCVLPRAVTIVEAMAAIVLADEYLINKTADLHKIR
jgi:chorismate synthase